MKIGIIGAGGHARTVISLLEHNNYSIQGVYDETYNHERSELIEGYKLLNTINHIPQDLKIVIAKATIEQKSKLISQFKSQLLIDNLIHPKSITEASQIGLRNQVSALTYISKTATVGSDNIIYSNSSIEHEAIIGNNNILTMNVNVCGRVQIGNNCFLGASSTILPGLFICDNVVVGAGALVTKDITTAGTYIGIPAKKIN